MNWPSDLKRFSGVSVISVLLMNILKSTFREVVPSRTWKIPLNIAINQKIIHYFLYLHNKGNDSIVKQTFLMSADLHSSGKSSFYSSVMRMSEYYNLPDFDPNVLNKSKIKHYI